MSAALSADYNGLPSYYASRARHCKVYIAIRKEFFGDRFRNGNIVVRACVTAELIAAARPVSECRAEQPVIGCIIRIGQIEPYRTVVPDLAAVGSPNEFGIDENSKREIAGNTVFAFDIILSK